MRPSQLPTLERAAGRAFKVQDLGCGAQTAVVAAAAPDDSGVGFNGMTPDTDVLSMACYNAKGLPVHSPTIKLLLYVPNAVFLQV